MTKYHPILFSTPMVQAILEGRKTMTRRVVKPQPDYFINCVEGKPLSIGLSGSGEFYGTVTNGINKSICAPYKVGDVLWVRESFFAEGYWEPCGATKTGKQKYRFVDDTKWSNLMPDHGYKYQENPPKTILKFPSSQRGYYKRNSLFMPKHACRIFLKIKSIKVERLQGISEEDAIAEGVEKIADYGTTGYRLYTEPEASYTDIDAVYSFESLWESINGKDSWKTNPFVFVYEFEQIEKPLDFNV